jgi:hypothetical protein
MTEEQNRSRRNKLRQIRRLELKLEARISATSEWDRPKLEDHRGQLLMMRNLAARTPRW